MEPDNDEVVFDAPEHFRIYKSGRIDRFHQPVLVAAGVDGDATGVASKDVVIDAGTGLSVRLFLPKLQEPSSSKKLPVLVYFHGGGFIIESARSATYHNYLTSLAAAAGVLAVSVDYRLAPEHRLTAAYEDCWAALRWAASARDDDDWLAEHGGTSRVFVAGDSAGGNIVHNVLTRASSADNAPRIEGAHAVGPGQHRNAQTLTTRTRWKMNSSTRSFSATNAAATLSPVYLGNYITGLDSATITEEHTGT